MTVLDGDILRVSARYVLEQGQDHVNVYYFKAGVSYSETDEDTVGYLHDQIDSFNSAFYTHLTNTADGVDVKVDIVEFVGGVETIVRNLGTVPLVLTNPPSAAGEPLPPGVAGFVRMLTTIGKVYGRKFYGMLTEAAQNSGVLAPATVTVLEGLGALLIANITTPASGVLIPGVMSKRQLDFVAFNAYDVSSNMAYQRRRRAGTGS